MPRVLLHQPPGDPGGRVRGIAIDPFLSGTGQRFRQVAQGVVADAGLDRHQVLEELCAHDPDQALGAGSPCDLMTLPTEECGLVNDTGRERGRKLYTLARDAVMLSGQLAANDDDKAVRAISLADHHRARGSMASGTAFRDLVQPLLRERRKQRNALKLQVITAHGSVLLVCAESLATVYQAIRTCPACAPTFFL